MSNTVNWSKFSLKIEEYMESKQIWGQSAVNTL